MEIIISAKTCLKPKSVLSTFSMIGAKSINANVNANDNLYIIALRAIQDSNFKFQDFLYDWGHVVVTILGEAAAEDDVGLLSGELAVLVGEGVVAVVVDGVVGFHALFVFRAVLFADHRLGAVIDFLAEHLEMLVFDDTGVGFVVTGVVDHGIALVVGSVLDASLECDGAPVEFAELEVEILVNGAGKYELVGNFLPIIS